MKVAVGSKNPVKIEAVKLAFEAVWPEQIWDVVGVEVNSGVSSQPMSDRESIRGAKNRAKRSIKKIKADYGVGLEGGVQKTAGEWFDCGWMVVIDKSGAIGIGSSIKMHTPRLFMDHVFAGKELGEVCDLIFKRKNSKQEEGQFGLMTRNLVTRTEGYRQGLISALVRFIHPELYE